MWWAFLPWLLFLTCLGGIFTVYGLRHRQEQRQLGPTPSAAVGTDDAHKEW